MKTTAGILVALLMVCCCTTVATTPTKSHSVDSFLRGFVADKGFPLRPERVERLCVSSGLTWASSSDGGRVPYAQYACVDRSSEVWIDVTVSSETVSLIEIGLRSSDSTELLEIGREWKRILGIQSMFGVPEVVSHVAGGQSWVLVDVYEVPEHYWVARMTIGDPLNPPVSTHSQVR